MLTALSIGKLTASMHITRVVAYRSDEEKADAVFTLRARSNRIATTDRARGSDRTKLPLWSVAWHSGRTSVFGRRTFPVLRSTCSWRVTIFMGPVNRPL